VRVKVELAARVRSGPYRSHWLYGLHRPLSFAECLLVEFWSVGIIDPIGSNRVSTPRKRKDRNEQLTEGDQRLAIAQGH
jgi:hypothetical protein